MVDEGFTDTGYSQGVMDQDSEKRAGANPTCSIELYPILRHTLTSRQGKHIVGSSHMIVSSKREGYDVQYTYDGMSDSAPFLYHTLNPGHLSLASRLDDSDSDVSEYINAKYP
jgi:hypothetical protein